MEFQPSEPSPVASTETPAATPAAEAVPSTSTNEAIQGQANPDPIAQPTIDQSGETVAATSEELPDDDAFGRLPGVERASNWQKARARIAEQNQKLEALSQLEQHRPTIEQIEQLGGFERLQQQAELAASLFSPALNEAGEQLIDSNGLPVYTSEPFLDRLVAESPSSFGELMDLGFDRPNPWNPTETMGHAFMRDRLGLNPDLLSTYQQITSPQDAAKFTQREGVIDPEVLALVDPSKHEALKSLDAELLEEFPLMTEAARNKLLDKQQRELDNSKFIEEQRAAKAQEAEAQRAAFNQQIQQAGEQLVADVGNRSIEAQRAKLQSEVSFSQEAGVNDAIHDEIIRYGQEVLAKDPILAKDTDTAIKAYHLSAYYQAIGDKFKAAEAKLQGDRLATKLDARFRNAVTERTGFWSRVLSASRNAFQQQVENAQPRVEINARTSSQSQRSNNPRSNPGNGFGFDSNQIAQWAAEMEQRAANR